MKKCLLPLLGVTFLLVLPVFAAKPTEPPYHLATVSWIISTRDNIDVDDRYVTLIGRITQKVKEGTYWFTDGTGSILLDSGDTALPVGKKVTIGGRIDQAYFGLGKLEIDVKQWQYAKTP